MKQIQIRKITEQDKELFINMSLAFYRSEAVLHEIEINCHERAFAELMRSEEYLLGYILEMDGKTAGYALLDRMFMREMGGIVVWIEELYVLPEFRGKGVGTALFAWVEKNIPAVRYRLEVEPDNIRAMELYKRLGYEALPYLQMVKDTK